MLKPAAFTLALIAAPLLAASEPDSATPASTAGSYVGTETCASCHKDEHENWQGSHHDLAMQLPTQSTVLGNFDDSSFDYNGVTTTFSRDGQRFMVRTDNAAGELEDFEVAYVFGVYPLQQYLLPMSGGRLQALNVAWDSRPATDGGQRWFHLYPDDAIGYDDPLHWTGPYHNWNTRCAECHSTDVKKQYDTGTRQFNTVFESVNVGCEACHGPGSQHIELAAAGKLADATFGGFEMSLAQRGEWAFPEGENIARRRQPLANNTQIDTCGRCHARRSTLGDYHPGADLLDTHRLSMLHEPLYYADGQIRDEVYVYGSFVQSKMHMAGVVCSNCHEPHSNNLRAPDNGVCAQCHAPASYDTPEHHHHPVASAGASCANCHMPETTYMVVDPRRDHSMRVPRPDLSVMMGTPNACNQCHTDQSADWALTALRDWGVSFSDSGNHPARAFHAANQGDMRAIPSLLAFAADTANAPIQRGTALEIAGRSPSNETVMLSRTLLSSDDALLRLSAVRSLQDIPIQNRYALLRPMTQDPVTAVRLEVASALAETPLGQISDSDRKALLNLFKEYEQVMNEHADMPSSHMQLGLFRANRGDYPASERAYREARRINHQLIPAYLNLADLLRTQQREDEARALLSDAVAAAPQSGDALHALGLLETRTGNTEQALNLLGRAAELEENGIRHRFVYAVALHDLGDPAQAVVALQRLNTAVPGSEQVLLALANYSAELGEVEQARRYAQRLTTLFPNNPNYQALQRQLQTAQ